MTMARVKCTILEVTLTNDHGQKVPGTRAECMRCDKVVDSFGRDQKSINRCLAKMREECEMDEENFYVED
jgi:hypothetical protein